MPNRISRKHTSSEFRSEIVKKIAEEEIPDHEADGMMGPPSHRKKVLSIPALQEWHGERFKSPFHGVTEN